MCMLGNIFKPKRMVNSSIKLTKAERVFLYSWTRFIETEVICRFYQNVKNELRSKQKQWEAIFLCLEWKIIIIVCLFY